MAHTGSSNEEIAEEIGENFPSVLRIISSRSRTTKCSTPKLSRRYLPLSDRLRVICTECGDSRTNICRDFEIGTSTYHRTIKGKAKWKAQAVNDSSLTIRRARFTRYLGIDAELLRFITFARNLLLPVPKGLMEERARQTAVALHIPEFKGSNGYIERLLESTRVHKSIRLPVRGGTALPLDHL